MADINLILLLIPAHLGIGFTLNYGFNSDETDWRRYYRWAVMWSLFWPGLLVAGIYIWSKNNWIFRRKS